MACASGAASIALGADLIREGVVPLAVVGGVDVLTRICFMGFNALKLLDSEPCRPFDRDRRGMSIGEAAAFMVLEEAERCRARGGPIYGEFLGAGMTTDLLFGAVVNWVENGVAPDHLIAQVNPKAYQEAGKYLRKAGAVMARQNEQAQWDQYLSSLRETHARKRRLLEILDGLDGKPIMKKRR